MFYKKKYHTGSTTMFAVILFLSLISCEELIRYDLDIEAEKNIVVEGMFTTESKTHIINLSYTSNLFNAGTPEAVTGAELNITDGEIVYNLSERPEGRYATDPEVFAEVGKTYTLNIRLPDGREYSASETVRPGMEIDSIKQSYRAKDFYSDSYGFNVLVYGQESVSPGDYYMYYLYVNNRLYTDTLTEVFFISDEFVNGMYVSDFPMYHIKEEDISDTYTSVRLDAFSIPKQYYEFLSALRIETSSFGSPWDGPPANIKNNISNGARGYFLVADVKRASRYFFPFTEN